MKQRPEGNNCCDGVHPELKLRIELPDIVVLRQISKDIGNQCSSEPSSRSSSFRKSSKPKGLHVQFDTYRRKSMPENMDTKTKNDPINDAELSPQPVQRVRSFRISSKGIVNRGDSFRRHNKQSDGSPKCKETSRKQYNDSRSPKDVASPIAQSATDVFHVAIVGSSRTGKSALKNQFMTSDYTGDAETVPAGEEVRVPILLDDEENTVSFTDTEEAEDCDLMSTKDAILIVYAVNEKSSFNFAKDCLFDLRQNLKSNQVIILVANKIDLVRTRVVSQYEGQKIAEQYRCKYVETSSSMNLNVDELLVAVVKQIRLSKSLKGAEKEEEADTQPVEKEKPSGARKLMKGLFRRFSKKKPKKKCEKLYEA